MFLPMPVGGLPARVFGSPMNLSATPANTDGAAPDLGQDNRQVYLDGLGMSAERFEALRAVGTI